MPVGPASERYTLDYPMLKPSTRHNSKREIDGQGGSRKTMQTGGGDGARGVGEETLFEAEARKREARLRSFGGLASTGMGGGLDGGGKGGKKRKGRRRKGGAGDATSFFQAQAGGASGGLGGDGNGGEGGSGAGTGMGGKAGKKSIFDLEEPEEVGAAGEEGGESVGGGEGKGKRRRRKRREGPTGELAFSQPKIKVEGNEPEMAMSAAHAASKQHNDVAEPVVEVEEGGEVAAPVTPRRRKKGKSKRGKSQAGDGGRGAGGEGAAAQEVVANPSYGMELEISSSEGDEDDVGENGFGFGGDGYNLDESDEDSEAGIPTSPPPASLPGASDAGPSSGGAGPSASGMGEGGEEGAEVEGGEGGGPELRVADLLDWTDVRGFLQRPVPPGVIFKCKVYRDRSGTARFFPKFYVYLEMDDGTPERFLMAARKRKKSKAPNYLISTSRENLGRDSETYLGKLRSNFTGTELVLYDDGESPDKDEVNDEDIRAELAAIAFLKNISGRKGPRQMRVLLPLVVPGQTAPGKWVALTKEASLLARYKREDTFDMIVAQNRAPVYNEALGAFTLNFSKRVRRASVKNFQIIYSPEGSQVEGVSVEDGAEGAEQPIILQFGRGADDNSFIMDFQWPLSPLQAFGIALSSCERKLGLE